MERGELSNLSREELIKKVEELQSLNREFLMERAQEVYLNFPWAGNLGHWYWDIRTNSVTFNPQKVANLGYSLEEVPEKVPFQYFTDKLHPDDYQRTMDIMMDHLNGRRDVYEVEYRIQCKDGRYKWYYDRGKITQRDPDGKPVFLAGIVFDVTEDKQAQTELRTRAEQDPLTQLYRTEKAVREIQRMLDVLPEASACGLLILDIDHFCTVNAAKGKMFGDTVLQQIADLFRGYAGKLHGVAARIGGDEFLLFVPSAGLEEFRQIAAELQTKITNIYVDDAQRYRLSASVGMTVTSEKNPNLLIDNASAALCSSQKYNAGFLACYEELPGRELTGFLGAHSLSLIYPENNWEQENILSFAFRSMEQVSDLKAALHILYSRIARQYQIDEVCVTAISGDGRLSECRYLWSANRNFLTPPAGKLRLTPGQYQHRLDWLRKNEALILTMDQLNQLDGECRRFYHSERLRSQLFCPVYVQGAYVGDIIYGTRQERSDWPKQTVRELRELSNIQYAAICKVHAESASFAKSEFLSRMSHEIRTPLNAIIGMIQIAKNNARDAGRLAYCLTQIDNSTRYLLSLVNNLLSISDLDSGNFSLTQEPFSIRELVLSVEELMRGAVGEHQQLTCDVRCTHENVYGDGSGLQQVLINLTANAVKFTSDYGKIDLSVEEAGECQGKLLYRFTVSDNGIGISQKNLERIYERFEQVHEPLAGQLDGIGLGLAVSSRLVQMMGSRLEVESEELKGSRFSFMLALPEIAREAVEARKKVRDLSGIKILVVEDNEQNIEVERDLLERRGAAVELARNGQEAVTRFSESEPGEFDVILMDIRMPVMDGFEAAERIRRLERPDSAVPIIAVTANLFSEDERKLLESGMNASLAKPVDINRLVREIQRCLDRDVA